MAFEREFLEFMIDTVTIERFLYMDSKKIKVYETPPRSYPARVAGKTVSLRRADKEESAVIVDIWLHMGDDPVFIEDRVTLPDKAYWPDRTPAIFAIGRYSDDDGQHNVKIQAGWMYHRQGQ